MQTPSPSRRPAVLPAAEMEALLLPPPADRLGVGGGEDAFKPLSSRFHWENGLRSRQLCLQDKGACGRVLSSLAALGALGPFIRE